MKTNYRPFARKYRQLNHVAKKIKRLHADGAFFQLSHQRQRNLVDRLKRLYLDLRGKLHQWKLKKSLVGLSFLLLGVGGVPQANAQVFGPAQTNPFSIESTDSFNFVAIADMDNDGDLDLFLAGYSESNNGTAIFYLKNDGTPEAADFTSPQLNPFGIQPSEYLTIASIVDIDDDGDMDLVTGTYSYGGDFVFQENIGTAENPSFEPPQVNPFGLTATNEFSVPTWADLDGDGDIDLIASENNGGIQFFENTGSAVAPAFAAPQNAPFGITEIDGYINFIDFADMDNDGDLDIMYGGTYDDYNDGLSFKYSENTGTATAPNFDEPIVNPFGLETQLEGYILDPSLADIDNDGDLDLFSGEAYGVLFFENLGAAPTSGDETVSTTVNTPYPFLDTDFPFMDADGDDFAAIKITSLVSVGMLELDGTAVTVDQQIPVADIPLLVFTPLPGEDGVAYDSFQFQVGDDVGALSNDYTMTIDVFPDVGTADFTLNATLDLFPNPIVESLMLSLQSEDALNSIQLKLISESGQLLDSQNFSVGGHNWQQSLNVNQLAAGTYFLQIWADDKMITKHFIKSQ